MRCKILWIAIVATLIVSCGGSHKNVASKTLMENFDQQFVNGVAQYKTMMKLLPDGRFPKTFEEDTLRTSSSGWWCSGFYPGSLLYMYEQIKDSVLLIENNRILKLLEKEQYNKVTHDLGFMMYCSFGNAERLSPSKAYEDILMNSAKSLITRFNPKVGCIKSWDSKNASDCIVIIDNMMNLELLFWATKYSGDSSFYKIAVTHANTTMKNHFRPDYSSFHVVNYNAQTGAIKQQKTAQGNNDTSAWARGQAWGLYGYTVMYRETKDKKYLEQANQIANFILTNPNLPADKIPYWDFDAPNIPTAFRDASAAAVMASALLELSTYDKNNSKLYFTTAEFMLRSLSAPPYMAAPGTNGGFILQHSVGHFPAKTEIDVPLTYADYYYLEAIKRYKEFK